jgi:hypothetical protein
MKDSKSAKTKASGGGRKREGATPTALNKDIQARIGNQLRAMHDDIVQQGVPDRFVDLLSRLDGKGK